LRRCEREKGDYNNYQALLAEKNTLQHWPPLGVFVYSDKHKAYACHGNKAKSFFADAFEKEASPLTQQMASLSTKTSRGATPM
jgi:hypothetical protein